MISSSTLLPLSTPTITMCISKILFLALLMAGRVDSRRRRQKLRGTGVVAKPHMVLPGAEEPLEAAHTLDLNASSTTATARDLQGLGPCPAGYSTSTPTSPFCYKTKYFLAGGASWQTARIACFNDLPSYASSLAAIRDEKERQVVLNQWCGGTANAAATLNFHIPNWGSSASELAGCSMRCF